MSMKSTPIAFLKGIFFNLKLTILKILQYFVYFNLIHRSIIYICMDEESK